MPLSISYFVAPWKNTYNQNNKNSWLVYTTVDGLFGGLTEFIQWYGQWGIGEGVISLNKHNNVFQTAVLFYIDLSETNNL